jgi:protein TonB
MSYHAQQNTQQRSIGMFIVIAFHVVLIWALANGLGKAIITIIDPEPIQLAPVEKQITLPPVTVDPLEPVIKERTKILIAPNELTNLKFDDVQPPFSTDVDSGELITTLSQTKPKLLKASKPDYPSAAARLGEEGSTSLKLLISADGRVADAQLVTSSGSSHLDEAAIKHAKRNWAFSPCTEGGKAVACWHQTKLVWQLKDAAR